MTEGCVEPVLPGSGSGGRGVSADGGWARLEAGVYGTGGRRAEAAVSGRMIVGAQAPGDARVVWEVKCWSKWRVPGRGGASRERAREPAKWLWGSSVGGVREDEWVGWLRGGVEYDTGGP